MLDAIVEDVRAKHRLPGLAALVYSSEGVVEVGAAGVRRSGGSEPLAAGDLLHIGSLTKAITVTMLATLVAEGRLEWESRLLDVVPMPRDEAHEGHGCATIADLVDHRAGIQAWTDGRTIPCFQGNGGTCVEGTPGEQRLAATRWLLARRPLFPRGRFRYSNGGYVILAAIAEHLTGKPWESLIRERLLRPLVIEPAFGWPLDTGPGQPSGHQRRRGRYLPVAPDAYRLPACLAPAGDLSLTLDGYARFGRLHLRAARDQSTSILDPASLRQLHPTDDKQHAGWQAGRKGRLRYLGGEGSAGTFYAISLLVPERDRGVIVIANAGGNVARKATLAVALRIFD
ncbi:MAG: beta-lactamase family protein [Thermoleophilia bacterium]|nr:beta-lactamase family protein [Thermoleophilia bacterium]